MPPCLQRNIILLFQVQYFENSKAVSSVLYPIPIIFVNQEPFTNPFTTKTRAQFTHSLPLTKEQGGLSNRFPGLQLPRCHLKFTFRKVNHWQASDSKREAKGHFVPMPWLIKEAQENGNFILTIFVMFIITSTTTMIMCVCVCVVYMYAKEAWHRTHVEGRSTLWSWFSPSMFMWVPVIEYRLLSLHSGAANTFTCWVISYGSNFLFLK